MAVALRKLRIRLGLTQGEAAELAGCLTQTAISQLERGNVPDPRVSTVRALARAYGVPVATVIKAIERAVEDAA